MTKKPIIFSLAGLLVLFAAKYLLLAIYTSDSTSIVPTNSNESNTQTLQMSGVMQQEATASSAFVDQSTTPSPKVAPLPASMEILEKFSGFLSANEEFAQLLETEVIRKGMQSPYPNRKYMKEILSSIESKGYDLKTLEHAWEDAFDLETTKQFDYQKTKATMDLWKDFANGNIDKIKQYLTQRQRTHKHDIISLLLWHDLSWSSADVIEYYEHVMDIINSLDEDDCSAPFHKLILYYVISNFGSKYGYSQQTRVGDKAETLTDVELGCVEILYLLERNGCF